MRRSAGTMRLKGQVYLLAGTSEKRYKLFACVPPCGPLDEQMTDRALMRNDNKISAELIINKALHQKTVEPQQNKTQAQRFVITRLGLSRPWKNSAEHR